MENIVGIKGHHSRRAHIKRQCGVATIAMAIILLILISIAVFTVNGSIVRETKVINSGVRSQQAFEAAEAGLSNAINYLANDPAKVAGVVDIDTYHHSDGTVDSEYGMTIGNGRAIVVMSDPTDRSVSVRSTGFSDDSTASRTISQVVARPDPLPRLPDNPLTARTNVAIIGSATIINPEGNTNIWTGGDVDLGSNNSTATEIANPQDPAYPGCLETSLTCDTTRSSDKDSEGQDLVQNDSTILNSSQEELFQFYFGIPSSVYRDFIVSIDTTGATANTDAQYSKGEIIWVDGNVELENITTIGCGVTLTTGDPCPANELEPSVLIVDGDLTLAGPDIFGLVYVTGNIFVTSSTDIQGAVIAGGSLQNTTSGSLDLIFNSDVLQSARLGGNMSPVSGSWKDFN